MGTNCKIINIDTIQGLSTLRKHCGTNATMFNKFIDFVVESYSSTHFTPKAKFNEWCKSRYNKEFDFINDDPNVIEEAIVSFYNHEVPSVKDTSFVSELYDDEASAFYARPEDRQVAIQYAADTILSIDKQYFITSRRTNPFGYASYWLDNRKGLAYELIAKSNLSKEDKFALKKKVEVAITSNEINKALKEYNLKLEVKGNVKSKRFYKNKLLSTLASELSKRISLITGESPKDIKARMSNMTKADMRQLLGDNDISYSDLNYLEMYWELKNDVNDKFFNEVIKILSYSGLEFYSPKSNDETDTDNRVKEETTQDESVDTIDYEDDNYTSIVAAYDHTGLTSDALDHVDNTVKSHLASIKKLNSTKLINGKPDYDRNNPLGVPQGIDLHRAYGFFYHQVRYDNVESMIRSIRNIADRYPDMVAFHTLADELSADEDLANMYWNTFAKIVIGKTITRTSPDGNEFYVSNAACDIKTTLRNRYLNSVRHSSTNVYNGNEIETKVNYLVSRLSDTNYKKLLNSDRGAEQKAKIINEVCELIRTYYPCIPDVSIKAFIDLHKDKSGLVDSSNNVITLLTELSKTIDESKKVLNNYSSTINRYQVLDKFNKNLDTLIENIANARKKENVSKEQIREDLEQLTTEDAKAYIHKYLAKSLADLYDYNTYKHADLSNIEVEDYTTPELRNLAINFADMMLDYSVVDADLNSVNAERNQVSSVINSSYLTNMINILQNEVILKKFGESRSKSSQYNFSNIMYEHINPETKEITYGLFRKDANGNITPTEYATELLRVTLFDGAYDSVSDKAVLYYKMTKGDYLGTAFVNYFDSADTIGEGDPTKPIIKRAGYFMRIPSDAKNNFVTTAPKYDVDGLYTVLNRDEIVNKIQSRINAIPKASEEDINSAVNSEPIFVNDKNVLIDFITNIKTNKPLTKRFPNSIFKNKKDGDEIVIKLQYAEDNNSNSNIFIVKGIVKDKKVINAKFVGIASEFGQEITSELKNILFNALDEKGEIKRVYNPNHPIFYSLKRVLKQEILDMATAIDSLFITDENGLISRYTEEEAEALGVEAGSPKFKPGISNDGNSNPGCYMNYHYNGKTIVAKENGTYKLTGNVFKSNRFTITDLNTGESTNYGNDLINQYLNPLYGGSDGTYIRTIKVDGKVVDVDLTSIDAQINDMISGYIDDITKNSIDRLKIYKDNITNADINFKNVSEFILNYRLTYIGFDDLFEGNSKFYKSDQDAFKRTKEVQGSGNPYGSPDFLTLFDRKYEEIENSLLSTDAFKDWGVKQHNQYRAVTVRNTKMTGETIGTFELDEKGKPKAFKKIGILSKQLIDEYRNQGFSADEAKAKAFEIMSRYYNPKVNDAQSYITFDEFIRRIARRGQLYKYKPLIDKIKNGEDLIAEELEEFIQVQKNFQYDQYYDESAQMFVPRQIKNAEFVLVPQLIRGTELEIVAKLMDKYGIDQLNTEETSKAGKSNILEVFDKDTGLLKEDIKKEIENDELPIDKRKKVKISSFGEAINNKHAIQYYNYEFLFTQQETHQHVNDENKAGVQIMKKLVDNIDETSELWPVKQKLINLFNDNIVESAKDYFSKLGVTIDKGGKIDIIKDENGMRTIAGLNLEKLYNIYIDELRRRKDDVNLLDFATLEDSAIPGQKQPKLPDFLTLTSKTLEQIAQSSINNNIVRQMLPGFHGPQVTAIGFNNRSINEIGGGKVNRKYSDKLKFYPNGEQYIQVMVSPSFFGLERRKDDGTLKTKEELLKELQDAKVDTFIGYRIPTEAKYSVAVMKVVDFVDDAYGSTIVVPNDWVAQTGSDFDVDSIYGITHNTYVDKNGILQRVKEGEDTKESRDNGILSCMLTIMQHHSTLEERLLTSNVDHITEAIDEVVPKNIKKAKGNRSQYNILDQVDNHDDAISGMELKAISVAWDGLISIANSVGFYLPAGNNIIVRTKDGAEYTLNQFGDNSKNNHRNYSGHLLTAYSAETSPYEFDAIKSGAIPNINKYTFGVFKFLSGIGVDYKLNLKFMTTPGVSRLVEINDRYNSIYSSYSPDVIKKGIEEIAKELNIDTINLSTDEILAEIEKTYNITFVKYDSVKDENNTTPNNNIFLEYAYIDSCYDTSNETNYKLKEIQTILDFAQIKKLADKFTSLSMVLRGDKISAKKSIYETEDILDKCKELANDDNPIVTKEGINVIDAIFPGLIKETTENKKTIKSLDIEGFMSVDRGNESKYKTLYSFMRYATIPSIIINKQLFSTESPVFDALVKKVNKFNKKDRKLTIDAKQQLVKYAISEIYGNVFLERTYNNYEIPDGFDRTDENKRIHGYKLVSEPLNILDVKNPTDDEIERFKLLSPAEQVLYIQDHFKDEDIFKLLEVELKPYDKKGHKINFNAINYDLEYARRLFTEAFFNSNELVNIAAHNLLKYAFIVEGYSMRKNGISNIVSGTKNRCLLEYVDNLRKEFNIWFGPYGTALTSNLALDFARSNLRLLSVPTHFVENNSKNIPELQKIGYLICVPDNSVNSNIINKYNIGIDKLVKLKFKKDTEHVLYYSTYISNGKDSMYVLYPLNKLEPFEHGEFSINGNNTKYPSSVYFKNIINELDTTERLLNIDTVNEIVKNEDVKPYLKSEPNIVSISRENRPFDLNNPSKDLYGVASNIKKKVNETFNGEVVPSTKTFGVYPNLDKYIKTAGRFYGEPQIIKVNEGTDQERDVVVTIWKLPYSDRNKIANYVKLGKLITDDSYEYKDVVNYLIKDLGIKFLVDNIYMITPPITISKEQTEYIGDISELKHASTRESSIENAAYQSYQTVRNIAKLGNASAARIKEFWKDNGIEYNKQSITDNIDIVLTKSAPMLRETVSAITSKIKNFYKDEITGEWLAINDPRLAPVLASNKQIEDEFFETINLVDSICSTNIAITTLNIDSHDDTLKHSLNTIRSAITELRDNIVVLEAKEMYAREVLGKMSTNPLIKQELIDIFSPHYSTNWLNSWFSDMLETSNPFAQVLLKKVTDDIYRKDLAARQLKRQYLKEVSEIYDKAKAAGLNIDLSKFIDDRGVVIQRFNDKLQVDLDKHVATIKDCKQRYEQATDFVTKHNAYKDYLLAKLDYDKFLIDHIEQPLVKEYYVRRYNLDNSILHGSMTPKEAKATGGFFGNPELLEHSDILVEYKILKDRQFDLFNIKRKGLLDDQQAKELDDIDAKLKELTRPSMDFYGDDDVVESKTPVGEEDKIRAKIRDPFARTALINYINELNNINDHYFQYDPEFGFEEELERNLKIIENRELRDANGNLTKPMSELIEDPEYVRAKIWMKQYTLFIPDEETEQRKNKAFAALGSNAKRETLKKLIYEKNARDDKGTIDARLFTDDEIRQIKEEQQREQMYAEDSPISDRVLISFAKHSNIVYNTAFYAGMMVKNAAVTTDWINTAKRINAILSPYYNETLGGIDWRLMGNTAASRAELMELGRLYRHLAEIHKKEGGTNKEEVKEFFEKNVDNALTKEEIEEFKEQETIAKSIGSDFYTAWKYANVLDNGQINTYLYHALKPKNEVMSKFVDNNKTEALKTLDEIYEKDYSEYYYAKYREMKEQGRDVFNEWYKANHIYNNRTRRIEPISCWISYQYKDNIKDKLKYIPKRNKTTKEPKTEFVNPNYKEHLSHSLNYIEGTGYDNTNLQSLNQYEIELKNYINTILHKLVRNDRDREKIDKGWLPYQRKQPKADLKYWGKELLSTFGWSVNNNGTDAFDDIDYAKNDYVATPMLELLDQVTPKEAGIIKPEKVEGESDDDFNKRMKEYENKLAKLREENEKRHSDAINKDWINVIGDFITEVGHYNAVQDNYEILYYGKNIIDDYKTYVRKFGFFGDYKYDRRSSSEDSPNYIMRRDENIAAQYENYVRRLLLNQWKESNEKVTKWAGRFQNLTSAQYMMMNIRGGIANVTLGQTQVAAEAHAKAIIDHKSWMKSEALYMSAIPSFATHMFDDKASTLVDAIIKAADIVDYDEKLGRARIVENPTSRGFSFFRKAMYSPQSIGEHYMQNRVLLSALLSHHLYTEVNPVTGKERIVFKNRGEVIADCAQDAMLSLLNDKQKSEYHALVENIKKDPNKAKEFAWYKDDFIYRFAKDNLSKQETKEYIKLRKELEEKRLKEFNNPELHPNVFSQLDLSSDGYMIVKTGSLLSKYDTANKDGSPSDAITAFAELRNRVVSVNKKIHGVYDKLGQAQIEKKWFGSLIMQYHKHIPIGINKRYRTEGYYNEIRGTVEKGSYVSLVQFLSTPFRKNRTKLNLTEDEANTLEGIKNIFKSTIDFTTHVSLYWNMLPEYEKANIRRNLGDIKGILIGILLAIVLKSIGGDDDDDSVPYNLALYEIDRLRSEAAQFTPIGSINEFKKLWSAPIAAQSGISDLWQTMDVISQSIFGGEEFDPYFRTGRFAGQHKMRVYIERRIPIWRGIKGTFLDITEQNTYYKLRQNVGGTLVNNILDWEEDN